MNTMNERPIKVILVGSCSAGKTSIISSYTKKDFSKYSISTVSPSSSNAIVSLCDGRHVGLQIWDTAGQEKYQSISQMFYRDSEVAVVCYEREGEEYIGNWIERVKEEVPDCIILLARTKTDLLSPKEYTEEGAKILENVDKYHVKAGYMTSAECYMGIDELFYDIASMVDVVPKRQYDVTNKKIISQPKSKEPCC